MAQSFRLSLAKNTTNQKDEHYVLDLCDAYLGLKCSRQHKFDFLLGDANKNGKSSKLPVDGYYETIKLAIEYCERQHTEKVDFFDKPERLTVSGVHRGEQRKIYDQRRRQMLTINGIFLLEISYHYFNYNSQKRIIRDLSFDQSVIKNLLEGFVRE